MARKSNLKHSLLNLRSNQGREATREKNLKNVSERAQGFRFFFLLHASQSVRPSL